MPSNTTFTIADFDADWYTRQLNQLRQVTVPSAPRANTPVRGGSERAIPRDALGRFASALDASSRLTPVVSVVSSPEVTPNAAAATHVTQKGIKGWFQRLDSNSI